MTLEYDQTQEDPDRDGLTRQWGLDRIDQEGKY